MTTATSVIDRAHREGNIIPLVATASANQQAEALPFLNEELLGCLGNEAGTELSDLPIGGEFDQSALCSAGVPANARLILNLSSATSLDLDPYPYEGQRLAIADAAGNLATNNLTLNGNGRRIEDATSLTLLTDGDTRQWLYRSDTANWVKITSLAVDDTMPLPIEFDSYFVTKLAMRLNPRYGQAIAAETLRALSEVQSRIQARYRKPRPVQDMGTIGLLGSRRGSYGLSTSDFNAGRTFR